MMQTKSGQSELKPGFLAKAGLQKCMLHDSDPDNVAGTTLSNPTTGSWRHREFRNGLAECWHAQPEFLPGARTA